MISFLSHFSLDAFALLLIWRALKMVRQRQQGLFETEGDYKLRKWAGVFLIVLGVLGIYLNHKM